MLLQQTLDKLRLLKLSGMAQSLEEQFGHGDFTQLSFEDRIGLLVETEWMVRQNRQLTRKLQMAKLKFPSACVEDINYKHPRGLDRGAMQELAACRWIPAHRNLIFTSATGLGKTWLACAFGQKACREGFSTVYARVPRLIEELSVARADGSYLKVLAALARADLLIMDDWGLGVMSKAAQHSLLEVIDDRCGNRSTIVTSQFPVKHWHETLSDPTVADAILDRLTMNATTIPMEGESMRKTKSK
jgi:DNA replication protein DnaC